MEDRYAEGLRRAAEFHNQLKAWDLGDSDDHTFADWCNNHSDEIYDALRSTASLSAALKEVLAFFPEKASAEIVTARAVLASIPPDPPPMASEDEAIATPALLSRFKKLHADENYARGITGLSIDLTQAEVANVITALSDRQMLMEALEGMVAEWDKLTRYGSPLAKAANENLQRARAALAKAKS